VHQVGNQPKSFNRAARSSKIWPPPFLFIHFVSNSAFSQRSCHVKSVTRCSCVETTSVHGVMYSRNYATHPTTTAASPCCRPSWGCNMTGPLESPSSLRNWPHERGAKSFSVELQVSTK